MNGILGTLLLLLDTKLLGEQVEYVMTMKHCADSLLCIINDVLMYSKLEADKLSLDASVFQIEDVCEGVGKLLGPLAAAKSVDMYFLVDPAVPQLCVGDPGRLRQVLLPSVLRYSFLRY
jgi:two-component system, sensor histidine kinase and response regulator